MKAIKGGVLFGILVLVAGACFDPPDFPNSPAIDYLNLCFQPSTTFGADTLVVGISFKDGNGDLGLSPVFDLTAPYNEFDLFVWDGTQKVPADLSFTYSNLQYPVLEVPASVNGKLIRVKEKRDPALAALLPDYDPAAECNTYEYRTIFIRAQDRRLINLKSTELLDSLRNSVGDVIYQVRDTFYTELNPTGYNIEVEFWVKEGGQFKLFEDPCLGTSVGRFPRLSEKTGPLEGDLRYKISRVGLRDQFSIKTLKLRIKIRDRDLNVSNVIETPEFTLDRITCR